MPNSLIISGLGVVLKTSSLMRGQIVMRAWKHGEQQVRGFPCQMHDGW